MNDLSGPFPAAAGAGAPAPAPRCDLRTRLRRATAEAHERMHAHRGFAAAADGAITINDYRRLLARLYGFHSPFEAAMRQAAKDLRAAFDVEARARAALLRADLATFGVDDAGADALPLCESIPGVDSEAGLLGALYVTEGSTLGGAHIARALRRALGSSAEDGRRFFLGHGERQGSMWRSFIADLERATPHPQDAERAERAAIATFAAFESWMEDWRREVAPNGAP